MLKLFKDQISCLSTSRKFFRHFAANINETLEEEEEEEEEEVTVENKRKKQEQASKITKYSIICEHLKSIGSEFIIKEFPIKLLKVSTTAHMFYIADVKAAEKFKQIIAEDMDDSSTPFVAEINPGVGLLTEKLLETSYPKIHLFEPSPVFALPSSRLQSIINKNPDRLELRKYNLLKLWKAVYMDFQDSGNRFNEVLEGRERRKWNEEPYMNIVGAVPNDRFIRQILMSVIFQNTFMEYGRIIFYLALPPTTWGKLTANEGSSLYKNRSVLFQLLFNYRKLGELPRKAYLPWKPKFKKSRSKKELAELKKLDCELLYLVRIEPKADLLDNLSPDELLEFFYFVKQHFIIKQTRIIPELEKWIPNCGPRLIAMNFNIYTEFRHLNPEEMLNLYKVFSSWPEFESSHFITCMKSYISRIEEGVFDSKDRFNLDE